ncbi:MAG: ThuA domain-containing protein [Phycisphaerae bacterium]|nr:ThuA domain-containing protein [Phycisphaerae bacterium]
MKTLASTVVLLACFGCTSESPGPASRPADKPTPVILFLVSEDPSNYKAHETIPRFADVLQKECGFKCTVIRGEGEPQAFRFPGLETIREADLVVIFFRRRALPSEQLAWIRSHLQAGRPLIGIRTANHAFSVQGDVAAGHDQWWEFVPQVLGCENRGYGPEASGTEVTVVSDATRHPVLKEVRPDRWHAEGSLYLVKPLADPNATVLLTGSAGDKTEPVAWTRMCGSSRIFYTSLGFPTDFEQPPFRRLLVNAVYWALKRPAP